MLRTLLTPLSGRFPLSPFTPRPDNIAVTPSSPDELAPEDFARDVLVEIMRTSLERLKEAHGLSEQLEVLSEIYRIMLEDDCTKDVFREMDGFLVLMSILATMDLSSDPNTQVSSELFGAVRLVFEILSEAMYQRSENAQYFSRVAGYGSLSQALVSWLQNSFTAKQTMGYLLSLALHNFSISTIFKFDPKIDHVELNTWLRDFDSALGHIYHPEPLLMLYNSLEIVPEDRPVLRYSVYKLLDRLSRYNHRNHCVINSLGITKSLFNSYLRAKDDATLSKEERQTIQKLLRRIVDMGLTTDDARSVFQRAVRADGTLDGDVLEILRAGMKVKWPEHFSLRSPASFQVSRENVKGLPPSGFTFMIWLRTEDYPRENPHPIFTFHVADRTVFSLHLRPDGTLECRDSSQNVAVVGSVSRNRWSHIVVVHRPPRGSDPSLRIYLDGIINESLSWPYPRPESVMGTGVYTIGDTKSSAKFSWCVASSYVLSTPINDDLVRFIHHLGPRYIGQFQSESLVKFFTYEASTALNIFLTGQIVQQPKATSDAARFTKLFRDGLGLNETSIVFRIAPVSGICVREDSKYYTVMEGDVFEATSNCVDMAMWEIGGAAIPLRLVQLASNPHELSRSLGILADGLRNSWQNSEDMERLRGYEILAGLLEGKSHLINMTGYETLFEFLGINFRSPDLSTIVNTFAYRSIALNFRLWSRTRKEIQLVHLEHFSTLLLTNKYKRFNVKQRVAKLAIVRKLLFALQSDWYQSDMHLSLIEALKVTAQAHFTAEDAIKPIVSFLAANLHPSKVEGTLSPHSFMSRFSIEGTQSKAELVLGMLVTILQTPSAYNRFISALPMPRICLLLLGEHPSSTTATHILRLIEISIKANPSFSRKFELVSGWNILKTVLPSAWNHEVQEAAFDVLLQAKSNEKIDQHVVVCPSIVPAIFAALSVEPQTAEASPVDETASDSRRGRFGDSGVEALLEKLIEVHSASPSFRQLFKSQTTTQSFIDPYRSYIISTSSVAQFSETSVRILEKFSHLGLSIALDNAVATSQKEEIMDLLQSAETLLNPRTSQESTIDPSALVGRKSSYRSRKAMSRRLSVQLGDSALRRTLARLHEWRHNIITTEEKRLRKTILDMREHHRQVSALTEWATALTAERGLWGKPMDQRHWQLDETEGPNRVRLKLEPDFEQSVNFNVEVPSPLDNAEEFDADAQSLVQASLPPWAEAYEISSTDMDGDHQLQEDIPDDKLRRVRHELEPGDIIDAVYTVARISGVDSSPGLLILGRTHIYMFDGIVENDDGEVVDAHEAPQKLFFVPGSTVQLDGSQNAHKWSHDQIIAFSDRTFLFRDVALEVYFRDSRSLLIVFSEKRHRQVVTASLNTIVGQHAGDPTTPGLLKSPSVMGLFSGRLSSTLSSKVLTGLRMDQLATAQRKWQAREISNFAYLSTLNQLSGRTPGDATQYPVFPWVLSDYTSEVLDLSAASSFRDLSCPMGALTPARREAAESRYSNLESVGEVPFHYGTHFSSSMIVCHFLIRMEPFTHMFKTLQGGDWDLPDRLFIDIRRAYESASQDVRGDVRELIPEFFTCPEFLENYSNLDFGVQQNTGEPIHDVKLPPWAKKDPLLFVTLNREALESDYVSEYLPKWIDLIWGCKQRDRDSLNVFHPLSYEGSVDLDSIKDDLERQATVGIIHNFGQTPRRLFHAPHPERWMHGNSALPIGTLYGIAEDYHLLYQVDRAVKDIGPDVPVCELSLDAVGQTVVPCQRGSLLVPPGMQEHISWDVNPASGGTLKFWLDRKVVQVIEAACCSCAAFADPDTLATGSTDHMVRLWRVKRGSGGHAQHHHHRDSPTSPRLIPTHIMRAHTANVLCVAASRVWSLVVSGSEDGSAVLWDLNRGVYVRSIWHGPGADAAVHLVSINESTGYIVTCSKSKLYLHTINARPIASLDLTDTAISPIYPPITSLAFLERHYSRIGILATGAPDGTITLRTWNTDRTPPGEKARWEFSTLKTLKVKGEDGTRRSKREAPCITALKFVGESLFHGEDSGKVFRWAMPD